MRESGAAVTICRVELQLVNRASISNKGILWIRMNRSSSGAGAHQKSNRQRAAEALGAYAGLVSGELEENHANVGSVERQTRTKIMWWITGCGLGPRVRRAGAARML